VNAASVSLDRLRRIGIIGAGQMGGGIAHVCALAGFDVVVVDINEAVLQRGREAIDRNLSRQVSRGKIDEEEKDAALRRIQMGIDYAPFADCGMVIEAATEKEEIKREIFKKLTPGPKA
jgi:3-hydroxybutyryl-CoA dehydrogenase